MEMRAVWEEAMTPLRHIVEEAEDAWDTQSREGTHGSTESKPSWVWHVYHERECGGGGEQP